MTKEKLIQKSTEIHGENAYDFSLVKETFDVKDRIQVICHEKHIYGEEHGIFETTYDNLINKRRKCGFCSKKRMTQDVYIKTANFIHNNKYDYTSLKYVNAQTKVKIICPQHGEYSTLPYNHLKYGCPQCGINSLKEKLSNSKERFIKEVQTLHNNDYEYDLTTYVNYKTPIKIYHKKCNHWFWQKPIKHINAQQGCPYCKLSRGQKKIVEVCKANNLVFTEEKRFDFLKNNNTSQRIDVFLEELQIGIEFQGEQHFKDVKIFGDLKEHIKRDIHKYELCTANNIKLIYVVKSLQDVDWTIPIYNASNTFELDYFENNMNKIIDQTHYEQKGKI